MIQDNKSDKKYCLRNYKSVFVSNLIKYKSNARTHSSEQIDKIVQSINEFGFTNPLLIDEENNIIAGHGRLDAAISIGMDEVPCIVLAGLSEPQKAALVIADNKIALDAGWDFSILQSQFEFLKNNDYNLELTGFGLAELCEIFPEQLPETFCDEDECPDVPEEPITKPGDVWLLGEHRLMCGNSTVPTDVEKVLDYHLPNIMITDPPYGVNLDMSWRDIAKPDGSKNNKNLIKNDDRSDWYDAYILFTGSIVYVWHANLYTDIVMNNLRDAGFDIKQSIIWNKSHLVLGRSNYHWKHEPCWYAIKKGSTSNWKGDRKQTTVWDCPSPKASCSGSKDDKTEHPTQKPVELFEKSINHHTNPGEYVYDPFAGSGTLMIACEKTKRRALMLELDPKYCDVIIKRYENYTNKKAVLEVKDVKAYNT
jgi:DNA modification methylase